MYILMYLSYLHILGHFNCSLIVSLFPSGTSNWSGDYFISTGGVSCIVKKPNETDPDSLSIPEELKLVFERDWNSRYTIDINTVQQPPYCHDNK